MNRNTPLQAALTTALEPEPCAVVRGEDTGALALGLDARAAVKITELTNRVRWLEDQVIALTKTVASMRKRGAGSNPRIGGKRR